MLKRTRVVTAALAAAFVMALAASTAAASQFEITEPPMFRAVWSSFEVATSAGTVRCPVTLEGYFNEMTLAKTTRVTVGEIIEAVVTEGSCTGGSASVLAGTLPWHIQYSSFTGSLPNITGISLLGVNMGLLVTLSGTSCLALSEASRAATFRAEREREAAITEMVTGGSIPLRGAFPCSLAGEARLAGRASVRIADETEVIRFNLGIEAAEARELIMDPVAAIMEPTESTKNVWLRNRARTGNATVGAITISNGTNFGISEAECETRSVVLQPNQANECRVRVAYIGNAEDRPRHARLYIVYRYGGFDRTINRQVTAKKN